MTRDLRLYTDGGLVKDSPSPYGASFAWCLVENDTSVIAEGEGDITLRDVDACTISSNVAELYAICKAIIAISALPDMYGRRFVLVSDSQNALGWFQKFPRPGAYNETLYALCEQAHRAERTARACHTTFRVKGHPSQDDIDRGYMIDDDKEKPVSVWNRRCDRICKRRQQALAAVLCPVLAPLPALPLPPPRAPHVIPAASLASATRDARQVSLFEPEYAL